MSRQPEYANPHRFQPRYVHHLVVVQVVDLAVRDKEEVGPSYGPRRRQHTEFAAIFQHGRARYATAIAGQVKSCDAKRADAVLNGNQAAVVPIKTIDPRKCASRPRIYVAAFSFFQVHGYYAQAIRDVQSVVVLA